MTQPSYKTMTTAQIRSAFLDFFVEKGSKLYPSSSLVPDDPSLLLTNAGMNQFKEYYQGLKTMDAIGCCSCQKCLRTNDIEAIGDARHLSFFEMLGNFSFGGYSKADAIHWAWEFITDEAYLGLPKDRLYMTVFEDDDESIELWHGCGVPYERISRLGADDNFWAAGPTGPCGPCSEIYFDQGKDFGCGKPDCAPGCDCDRFLEFWNLVFTQYDRQEDGSMPELPHRNIDTGLGLERMAAIMQHKSSNYDGDLLSGLIDLGTRLSGRIYGTNTDTDRSLRIVADHSRAVSFMISDGILPSNESRGYVLRRLLRRAVYHGRMLGMPSPFLDSYAAEVVERMGDTYPALVENRSLIEGIIRAEEEHFGATLDAGEGLLEAELHKLASGETLSGDIAFKLHDTYGFPIDLTREICENAGIGIDLERFDVCMEAQRSRARAAANRDAWSSFNDIWSDLEAMLPPTRFTGYTDTTAEGAKVLACVREGASTERLSAGDTGAVVLDTTPFYAERGGQIGDTGYFLAPGLNVRVLDTKPKAGLYVHEVEVLEGALEVGSQVRALIDEGRRKLIERNHTATHLLDAALKAILGDHVSQAGSLVAPDRLRFDFTHFSALSEEELARIEGMVNAEIFAAEPMVTAEMPIEEAKKTGAVALFGEKYGDVVRVVSTGSALDADVYSRELCGGTHVNNTADIGLFKIVSEGSVGANARRIEAVTSMGAISYVDERLELLSQAAALLKCRSDDVPGRIEALRASAKDSEKRLKEALSSREHRAQTEGSVSLDLGAYRCEISRADGVDAKGLREVWDGIREGASGPVACVLAAKTPAGTVALLAAGTQGAVDGGFSAGTLIGELAGLVGGRGGGRATMAQAGGADASRIDEALVRAQELLRG